MTTGFIQEFMVPIILCICFLVGEIVKVVGNELINKKYLPIGLPILGVLLAIWIEGFMFTPEILLKGLASGWAATGAFEAFKRLSEKGV